MTIRKIILYFSIIIIFTATYWVTMIIPNKILYLGYALYWDEVIRNNKIPLQLYIFNYGLTICLVGFNSLEVFFTKNSKLWVRLIVSWFTILLIYLSCYFLFQELRFEPKIWNMFYHPRGIPAIGWCIITLWLTSAGIISIPLIKKILN